MAQISLEGFEEFIIIKIKQKFPSRQKPQKSAFLESTTCLDISAIILAADKNEIT